LVDAFVSIENLIDKVKLNEDPSEEEI